MEAIDLKGVLRPWFGWRIRLPVFEGPFELLLYLIEKNELDITKVSLAQVADQYMEYLEQASSINLDALADFLVVAARLLALKSRFLLPSHSQAEELAAEGDEGDSLVDQLILYRAFRDRARYLQGRETARLRCYVRVSPPARIKAPLGPNPYSPRDLRDAFLRLLGLEETVEVSSVVAPVKVTIEEKMALMRNRLREGRGRRWNFLEFLGEHPTAQEVIATFMALLELVRLREAFVYQERLFGPIYVIGTPALSYP